MTDSDPAVRVLDPPTGTAGWLRDLVMVRTNVEEEFGWPVTVEVQQRRLVVAVGGVLDAVTMPAALGGEVLAQLRIAMLSGPVINNVDGRWTFLTTPEASPRSDVPVDLDAHDVRFTPRGEQVAIPEPSGDEPPQWIQRPRARGPLPPWPAVVATTRRVVDCRNGAMPGHGTTSTTAAMP